VIWTEIKSDVCKMKIFSYDKIRIEVIEKFRLCDKINDKTTIDTLEQFFEAADRSISVGLVGTWHWHQSVPCNTHRTDHIIAM